MKESTRRRLWAAWMALGGCVAIGAIAYGGHAPTSPRPAPEVRTPIYIGYLNAPVPGPTTVPNRRDHPIG